MSRLFLCFSLSLLISVVGFAASDEHSASGGALIREMNLARQNPALYAAYVEELRAAFNGNYYVLPGGTRVRSKEGKRALDDTIRFCVTFNPYRP